MARRCQGESVASLAVEPLLLGGGGGNAGNLRNSAIAAVGDRLGDVRRIGLLGIERNRRPAARQIYTDILHARHGAHGLLNMRNAARAVHPFDFDRSLRRWHGHPARVRGCQNGRMIVHLTISQLRLADADFAMQDSRSASAKADPTS